jgi:V/A-type H+-transporting ATPase subunit G/H
LAEQRLEEARAEIESEREEILEAGRETRDRLESQAEERIEEVVEYVLEAFEEGVHAQT